MIAVSELVKEHVWHAAIFEGESIHVCDLNRFRHFRISSIVDEPTFARMILCRAAFPGVGRIDPDGDFPELL